MSLLFDQELHNQLAENGVEELTETGMRSFFWEYHDEIMRSTVIAVGVAVFILLIWVWRSHKLRMGIKTVGKSALARLDTQTKRKGALCLIVGIPLMIFGVLHRGVDHFDYRTFIDSIGFERSRYDSEVTFGIGFYLAIIGLILSSLYDWTIGPIVRWIKSGS